MLNDKMSLSEKLFDSSRITVESAAIEIGDNIQEFEEALELAFEEKAKVSARASRVVFFCMEREPEIFKVHIPKIISVLPKMKNQESECYDEFSKDFC